MVDQEKYQSKLDYIFNQIPSYQQVGKIAYKEGLDTMLEFDKISGSPHKSYLVIHVAGTNGKGSVSHMIASVLMSCGIKVGLYTSPHLVDFRERIKVNGQMIPKESVYDFLEGYDSFISSAKPSFFEITTAMAFDYFRKSNVDIAVVETGLGGRLDSTNIVSPIISIITNIAMDHCEHLGYSLVAIAKEKGGIIKENVPVVVGEYSRATRDVFESIADSKGSPLIFSQEYTYSDVTLDDYDLDLYGDYQVHNLRTVLTALKVLSRSPRFMALTGENWSDVNIREGLKSVIKNTGFRGRWEYLSLFPPVICDTGHNVNGLSYVFSQLRRQDFKRMFCLIGIVADKDLDKILGLLPQSAYYLFTNAKIERALDAGVLAERCRSLGLEGEVVPSVQEAIARFKEFCTEGDMLFIGGSTFVVGEAIQFFEKNENFFAN
jgi:dihydrofolate synthase/folylpolyglutamate synthase